MLQAQPRPSVAPQHGHSVCPGRFCRVCPDRAPLPFREQLQPRGQQGGRWHKASEGPRARAAGCTPGRCSRGGDGRTRSMCRLPEPDSCLISQALGGRGMESFPGPPGQGLGRPHASCSAPAGSVASPPYQGFPELRHAVHRTPVAGDFTGGVPTQFPPQFPRPLQETLDEPEHPPAAALHRGASPLVRGGTLVGPRQGTTLGPRAGGRRHRAAMPGRGQCGQPPPHPPPLCHIPRAVGTWGMSRGQRGSPRSRGLSRAGGSHRLSVAEHWRTHCSDGQAGTWQM